MITAALLILSLAAPTTAEIREAELLAAKGVASYRASAFVPAAEYFLRAFELSGEPTQLFNAAKAYDAAGEHALARKYWYELAKLPNVSDADRREAKARLAARKVAVIEPPTPTPPPQALVLETAPPVRESSSMPWLMIGGGAASAGAGAVLWIVSMSQLDALNERLDQKENGLTVGIAYDEAVDARSHIGGLRAASAIAVGLGIASIVGGIVWTEREDTFAFVPSSDGAIAAYGATW